MRTPALLLALLCAAPAPSPGDYRITDFGAVADGTTDCAPSIQQAINEAAKAGGGTVVFPASEKPYLVGRTLKVVAPKIRLVGDGATLQLVDDAVKSSDDHLLWIKGTPDKLIEDIGVRGLTLDANVWNQPRRKYTVNVKGTPTPREYLPRGLMVEYARNVLCDRVRVKRAWVGLALADGTQDSEARDCAVTDWHNDGFETGNGARNIKFLRCRASEAKHDSNGGPPGKRDGAWEIEDGVENVTLEDCVIEKADGVGFHVKNHNRPFFNRNIRFLRCEAHPPSQIGFWVQGVDFDSNASGVVIKDCRSSIAGKDKAIQCNDGVDEVEVQGGAFGTVFLKNPRSVRLVRVQIDTLRIKSEKHHDGKEMVTPRILVEESQIKEPLSIEGDASTVTVVPGGK